MVGQNSFLLELDTEQIPNIFEVKLNTDGTILNVLQSKYHTRKKRKSLFFCFFFVFTNINVGGIVQIYAHF